MGTLNYTPLQNRLSLRERLKTENGKFLVKIYFAAVSIMTLAIIFNSVIGDTSTAGGSVVWLILLSISFAIFIVFGADKESQLVKFAQANQLRYARNAPYDGRHGLLFDKQGGKYFSQIFTTGSHLFNEVGNFSYECNALDSTKHLTVGYMRIKLPRRLPHMVLNARKNDYLGKISNLSVGFEGGQKVSLEGDFDQYFTLYAPVGYHPDAFYVFTPDVMRALIDSAAYYDCEIIDDDLYVYGVTEFGLTSPKIWKTLESIAAALRPELTQQTRLYADERVDDRALNLIAPAGKKLIYGINPVIAAVATILTVGYILIQLAAVTRTLFGK